MIVNMTTRTFVAAEERLHWFQYEDPIVVNANGIELQSLFPVAVEFNQETNEFCVATKSDVRVIDG